ncbi:MAG: hypothetical protein ABSD74_20075 [Rhizomicrobium sp.]
MIMLRLGLSVAMTALVFACGARAEPPPDAPSSVFDKPLKITRIPLPRNPQNPEERTGVTCWYYGTFMVKQLELGYQGPSEIAILPGHAPVCQRRQLSANELVIHPNVWTGYFKGVAGNYVFFDGVDSFNGGRPFVILAPDAKRISDDVAVSFAGVSVIPGGLKMRYTRVYTSHCSIAGAHAHECWQMISKETGLTAHPDCKKAYVDPEKHSVFGIEDPSVLEYAADETLVNGKPAIVPVAPARAALCRMAE